MKRNIFYNIICILAILFITSACQDKEWGKKQISEKNCLTLKLNTIAVSRVPDPGEDRFNENKIERADVFFFSSNPTENENQSCIYAQLNLIPNGNILQIPLSEDITEGSTYYIYVVANKDVLSGTEGKGKTFAELRATTIETAWKNGIDGSSVIEESLVMDGTASITLLPDIENQVNLTRTMAKVMLFPTAEAFTEEEVTYTPVLSRMKVTMVYAVKKTNLADSYSVQKDDYIESLMRNYVPMAEGGNYEQAAPFYSYPNPENTNERKDAYLLLCVPWSFVNENGDQTSADYYYRIPITGNDSPALMIRNKYYEIHAHISVLGSLDHTKPIPVSSNFIIKDWSPMSVDAEMSNYQYLVLDEYNSVMNNVDVLEMPYISSSLISTVEGNNPTPEGYYTEITEVSLWDYREPNASHMYYAERSKHNYEDEDGNEMEYGGQIPDDYSIRVEGDNLVFSHPLTNDDYVAITITITVYNEQGIEADEWTITQYPAMYIEGEYNRNGLNNRFVYGTNGTNEHVHDDSGNNRSNNLGGLYDPTVNATNSNLNQYTIYTSSFDIGDKYAIGDPRNETVDNLVMQELQEKRDNRNEQLDYYYSTRQENVEELLANGSVVAPAFKIASSWGVVDGNGISFTSAKRRCASYQENGYPAGRWRVPTEGEIEYIVGLSDAGKIPALFNGDYFASTGRYYDNGYESNNEPGFYEDNSSHSVRCVYDVWYWGNEKISNPNRFTWGDEPKR